MSMSTKLPTNRNSDNALRSVSKGALTTQVSAITLHQLSRALSLSQKNKNKNNRVEVQYVTLLSFYSLSLSMNSTWSKPSIHLLCTELIRKGKTGEGVATICFILSLASRKFIDGNQKSRTGWEQLPSDGIRYKLFKCASLIKAISNIRNINDVLAFIFCPQKFYGSMGEDGREKGIKANNNNINNNPSSPNSIMTLPQENGSGLIEAPVAVPVLTSPQHVQPYSAWEHREETYQQYTRILGVEREYPRVLGVNRYDGRRGDDNDDEGREGSEGGRGERGRDRERGSGRGREESRRERRRRSRRSDNNGEREEGEEEVEIEVEEGLLQLEAAAHPTQRDSTYGQRAYVQCYSTIHYVDAIPENQSSSSVSNRGRNDNYSGSTDDYTGGSGYRNTGIADSFYPDIGDYDLDNENEDDDYDMNNNDNDNETVDNNSRHRNHENDSNNEINNDNGNSDSGDTSNNDISENNNDVNNNNSSNNTNNNSDNSSTSNNNNNNSSNNNLSGCVGSPYRLRDRERERERERERRRQSVREADRERSRIRGRNTSRLNDTGDSEAGVTGFGPPSRPPDPRPLSPSLLAVATAFNDNDEKTVEETLSSLPSPSSSTSLSTSLEPATESVTEPVTVTVTESERGSESVPMSVPTHVLILTTDESPSLPSSLPSSSSSLLSSLPSPPTTSFSTSSSSSTLPSLLLTSNLLSSSPPSSSSSSLSTTPLPPTSTLEHPLTSTAHLTNTPSQPLVSRSTLPSPLSSTLPLSLRTSLPSLPSISIPLSSNSVNTSHRTEHGNSNTNLITRTQNSNSRLMLLVVGIFLTLLSYLGSVMYHSQNHGFRGITSDNSYHGYGDNTVESNDIRISDMRNAAAVLEEHSLPNPLFAVHSLRVGANDEIYSEQANSVLRLSNTVENENENENEGVLEIEKKESNEETREEEEDGVTVEVSEEEVEADRVQHEISFDTSISDIQSSSPPSSSSSFLSPSLTAAHTIIENINTDRDVSTDRERERDINEDNLVSIENRNADSNLININNDYEIDNNEISHNSQTNIQRNEIFNVPFPENISDSNEINGFVSEEKIRKFLFVLLKSFEHLHSSDCF